MPTEITPNVLKENLANPAPLGLFGFGMTTILLNLHNAGFYEMNSMILAMGLFYGGLAQVTYKIPETNLKLGFNYGSSRLSRADNETNPTLVKLNDKFTLGVYDQLTPNLMLLAEGTSMWSRNQLGDENKAWVANVGAFVSF